MSYEKLNLIEILNTKCCIYVQLGIKSMACSRCLWRCAAVCFVALSFSVGSVGGVTLECQGLYDTLTTVWNMQTGSASSKAITCENSLINVFTSHMLMDGVDDIDGVVVDDTSITINDSVLTEERVKMWMVHAFLGKQFLAVESGSNAKYFEYSETTGQVARNMLKCEFQQTLYLTLIVVLILLLVSVLLWDALKPVEVKLEAEGSKQAQLATSPSNHQEVQGTQTLLKFRIPHTLSSV